MKADGFIHPKEEEYMDKTYSDFSITISDLEDISNIDDIQTKLVVSGISDENKSYRSGSFHWYG